MDIVGRSGVRRSCVGHRLSVGHVMIIAHVVVSRGSSHQSAEANNQTQNSVHLSNFVVWNKRQDWIDSWRVSDDYHGLMLRFIYLMDCPC